MESGAIAHDAGVPRPRLPFPAPTKIAQGRAGASVHRDLGGWAALSPRAGYTRGTRADARAYTVADCSARPPPACTARSGSASSSGGRAAGPRAPCGGRLCDNGPVALKGGPPRRVRHGVASWTRNSDPAGPGAPAVPGLSVRTRPACDSESARARALTVLKLPRLGLLSKPARLSGQSLRWLHPVVALPGPGRCQC